MSATTSNRGYGYPTSSANFSGLATDIQGLAEGVDADVEAIDVRVADIEYAPTTLMVISKTFTNNTIEQITFTSSLWDAAGAAMWDGASNQLVVPSGMGGLYEAGIVGRFASQTTAAGQRNVRIYKNGAEEMSFTLPAVSNLNSTNIPVGGVTQMALSAGDIVTYWGYQNSGGSLAFTGNSRAWLRRLAK